MRLTSSILIIFVFLSPNKSFGQGETKFLDPDNLTTRSVYKILKHDLEGNHSEWTYYSETLNYLTANNLEISNHRSFAPRENNCYQTKWLYVDERNNYININDGVNLCKEPPIGGSITLNKLEVKIVEGKVYVEISDSNGKLNDKFEIKGIEYKEANSKEIVYKLKLDRVQL